MPTPEIKPTQHCTYVGDDDYTFSHTAGFCGQPQPRRCGCPFCYDTEEEERQANTIHIIVNGDNEIIDAYREERDAEEELYRLNNVTAEAKRLAQYGRFDWYRIIEKELL